MTKKEQIIDTAIRLFATEGFDATGIQRLAEEAGVAQGLLYRHFKNKQALLQHIKQTCVAQVVDTLLPYSDAELSFDEAFREHISRSCKYLQEHRLLWKVFHASRLTDTEHSPEAIKEQIEQVIIRPIAGKLEASGHKQPEMLAWVIFSLVDGLTGLYMVHPKIYPLSKMEQFLIEKVKTYENL